jgi:integrase
MPRQHGTGRIYVKWGSYYGRWRTPDGRYVNPRLGKVRERGEQDGLSRRAAERVLRRLLDVVSVRPAPTREERPRTVDDAADTFRERLVIEGARLSYRQNCESMQRVHISPGLGRRRVDAVKTEDIERLARALLAKGLAPKTVRNTMTFLHSVFALAVRKGWATDASPDLQFLTPRELDAVIAVIPDVVVDRDSLGPVLRLVILAAGTTGVRQSELLGMRWRDIDAVAQRVRIRNAWVRGENSGEGKSDLSTSRLVPMTDRLALELRKWRLRTVFGDDDELVFGHPELGTPLDRTKVTRRFKKACREAGVRVIRFHDLRHTFATTLAAAGVPLRTIAEYLGHADLKTLRALRAVGRGGRAPQRGLRRYSATSGTAPSRPIALRGAKEICPLRDLGGLSPRDGRFRSPARASRRRSRALPGLQRRADASGGPERARAVSADDRGRLGVRVDAVLLPPARSRPKLAGLAGPHRRARGLGPEPARATADRVQRVRSRDRERAGARRHARYVPKSSRTSRTRWR